MANPATGADGHAQGMPQLDFTTYGNQVFWLVAALVATFIIVRYIAIPRISAILKNRADARERNLQAAERMRREALESEERRNEAIARARQEASQIIEGSRSQIKASLEEATEKANAQIAEQTEKSAKKISEIKEGAAQRVAKDAQEIAKAMIGGIAPGKANGKEIKAAVEAKMKETGK